MLIPLNKIIQNTGIKITGVIHVGGHHGQEADLYYNNSIKEAHFFEPQETPFQILKNKCDSLGYRSYNVALGSTEQVLEMYVEEVNEGQSSSLLEPVAHLQEYPNIVFTKKVQVPVKTLDSYNIQSCNYLNLDVQGYELEVLKGAVNSFKNIDIIYTEVSNIEFYKNNPRVEDLVNFLNTYKYILLKIDWFTAYPGLGEAVFIKYT